MSARAIETMLRERIGLDPSALGMSGVSRAVAARMSECRRHNLDDYSLQLAFDTGEWTALVGELLVAETWFFRGGRALFDSLANGVRTAAESTGGLRPIRIASIPCSTGEEPYSLAIALEELGVPKQQYHIDGIDLSESHLARARAGSFTAYSFREPPSDLKQRWFVSAAENRWELTPAIRRSVRFLCGNIIDREFLLGQERYDLILCRNLFIYLTSEARGLALANLDRLLVPEGRLCLTSAEADRLPLGRYLAEGPGALAVFRKVGSDSTGSGIIAAGPRSDRIPKSIARPTPPPGSGRIISPIADRASTVPRERAVLPAEVPATDPRALADAGRIAEALAACDSLLKSHPASADLYSLLGVIRMAAGNHREAGAAFRSALYLRPEHTEALSYSIVLHDQFGEADQAAALRHRLARVEGRESS